jgi:RNA polymerase sigma-70 factor (ECF subfamily)
MINNEENEMEVPKILNLDDDFTLIKRFNEGDEFAFKKLVGKHKEKVRNLVYLTVGNSNAIDDISQDVFITLYRSLGKFRFDSQFTTWLYRVTINKCKDHLRKVKLRSIFMPLKDEEEELPAYSEFDTNSDVSEIVQNAIRKLPDKLRIPLVLREIQGMSYQEIADSMQSEIGTVKSRIFRAREGLKAQLKPYEKELIK